MMKTLSRYPLTTTVITCIAMAGLGIILVGDGLQTWYPQLRKPVFLIPIWAFSLIGILYYFLFGTVIFRILKYIKPTAIKYQLFCLTVTIMLLNELWNFAFFHFQSTRIGFMGIVVFLLPLLVLTVQLIPRDKLAGILLVIYCGWVLYDIAWTYALWQLNP